MTRVTDWLQQVAAPFTRGLGNGGAALWAPRVPLEALFDAVRGGMLGRRVEVGEGDRRVAFTLTGLEARFDAVASAAGQADDVELVAGDIEYAGVHVATARVHLDNVHTRIGMNPTLVAAPVDVTVDIDSQQAATYLERFLPKLWVRASGIDRVRIAHRALLRKAWLEAGITVVGGRLTLAPVAIGWSSRSRTLRRRWPVYTAPLALPPGVRLIDVGVTDLVATVRLRIDEWRFSYSRILGLARRGPKTGYTPEA